MIRCKKKIALCLALVFLFGLFSAYAVFADAAEQSGDAATTLTIETPASLPKTGESFTVAVNISGSPGLCAAQFTLTYDKTAMECTAVRLGEVLKNAFAATNEAGSQGAIVAAASSSPLEGDGTLAVFSFRMLRDTEDCTFDLLDVILADGEENHISYSAETESTEASQPDSGQTPTGPEQPTVPPEEPAIVIEQPTEPPKEPAVVVEQPTVTPEEPQESSELCFSDVSEEFWGAPFIAEAVSRGLFNGYPDGSFHPNDNIKRGEFVTVLWRSAGSPEPENSLSFSDVPADAFYAKAVAWAAENGYVNGTGEATFDPDGVLQRQAAMSILFRYSGGMSGMELLFTGAYNAGFADSGKIASWAKDAMYWGYYNGIINGVGGNMLSPQTGATRAQIAKILVNYQNQFGK